MAYVPLPSYNPGNALDFSPVQNALSQIQQQSNVNRDFGLQQQASARADQQLDLQKQETASALKTQAAQYENLTHQILGSTAQGALSVQDANARAAIANGIVSGHPEMASKLQQYGIDAKNPDSVLNFFANYGQNPLDIASKKAQIAQAQQATAASQQQMQIARAPEPVVVGTGLTGNRYATRNPLTGELTPLPESVGGGNSADASVKSIGDSIISGKQPPVLTGLGQGKTAAAVKAYLADQGFDLTKANLDWESAHKQVLSLNGPQMVRYAGLTKSVVNTIDEVNNLAKEMNNSGLTAFNAAKLATLVNTAGNTKEGQLASKYLAAVNTLKEEFANLAQGGYAPTEAAWGLANSQINANYGVDQLNSSLNEVQRLLNYRLNGIPNMGTLGPGAANRYVGNGQAAESAHGAAPAVAPPASAVAPDPEIDPSKVPAGKTFTFRGHTLRALGNGQFEQVQ